MDLDEYMRSPDYNKIHKNGTKNQFCFAVVFDTLDVDNR